MKFLETKLEDYIRACEQVNLHPEIATVFGTMSNSLRCQNNIILYGPPGVGKYTQALNYIKKFSPSNLKYERKMFVEFQKKKNKIMYYSVVKRVCRVVSTNINATGMFLISVGWQNVLLSRENCFSN